jgi:hypothetical protein
MIGCVDCHNNNDWTPTGNAPRGPHASRYSPILEKEYLRADPTPESYANYEMCYKCHDRSAIINPAPLGFPHDEHVVQQQAPCAVCHDAHGSQQSAHLINFMVRDETGKSVVTPSSSGRLEYVSTGPDRGSCYLQCHGADHNPAVYPR